MIITEVNEDKRQRYVALIYNSFNKWYSGSGYYHSYKVDGILVKLIRDCYDS